MRGNSGIIGEKKEITRSEASGIHDTFDQYTIKRDNLWPTFYDGLFEFTSFTFTSPNEDPFAPSSSDITGQSAYSSTTWASDTTYFNVQDGIQYFKIPATGSYTITAKGASGKSNYGSTLEGLGGIVRGTFTLTKGDILAILVGQRNPTSTSTQYFGGGAGGTFVATVTGVGNNTTATPLLVAGGGATTRISGNRSFCDANMSPDGKNGNGSGGTQGTEAVGGGHNRTGGGGAAGWSGIGDAHGDTRDVYVPTGYPGTTAATAYLRATGFIESTSPGIGGIFNIGYDTTYRGSGGFGGGGPGGWGGTGGAGGYSGGGNGNNSNSEYGGGGGSFISSSATNVGTSTGSWSQGSGAYSGHSILSTTSNLTPLSYNAGNGSVYIQLN